MNDGDLKKIARLFGDYIKPLKSEIAEIRQGLPNMVQKAVDAKSREALSEIKAESLQTLSDTKDVVYERSLRVLEIEHQLQNKMKEADAKMIIADDAAKSLDADAVLKNLTEGLNSKVEDIVADLSKNLPTLDDVALKLAESDDLAEAVAGLLPEPAPGEKGADGIDRPVIEVVDEYRDGEKVKRGELRKHGGSVFQATKDIESAPGATHEGWSVFVAGVAEFKTFQDEEDPRRVKTTWKIGTEEKASEFYIPHPIHCGPWEIGKTYQSGDEVSLHDGTFRAMRATQTRPGDGNDWQCTAKGARGRKGEAGDRGPAGPRGEKGNQGASIVRGVLDGKDLVFERDDESTFTAAFDVLEGKQ